MAEAIEQGDVWWVADDPPLGSEPGFLRLYVVVQGNALNRSEIKTVIACPMTTNLRLAGFPGNVLLRAGEGGLHQDSVVNVSGIMTHDRSRFERRMGTISPRQVNRVIRGINQILDPSFP